MLGDEPDAVGDAERRPTLVLHVRLAAGDPLVGSVRLGEDGAELRFRGWIAFMSAIDHLRATAKDHWSW
jgi:hypothetical protein